MAEERKGVLMYKYLSTQRPVSIGTYPLMNDNRVVGIANFGKRISILGCKAWGWLEFEKRLPAELVKQYDLVEIRMMI